MKEKKSSNPINEEIIQKCIDLSTGRDITAEHISERLKELEKLASDIISKAIQDYHKNPENSKIIYEKYYWEIHQ
ncbi:hypothetical protein LCGC14_0891380, partial [marine sediment metagenome]